MTGTFKLNNYLLRTAISGDGTGTISSDPAGINCGVNCTHLYPFGTVVTLTAPAANGSVFTGWEGACTGFGNCQTTLTTTKQVTATYAFDTYDLFVTVNGDGPGTISSTPAGISCGSGQGAGHNGIDCGETINYDTLVTLNASYDPTQMSLTWGGSCSTASGDSCTVTMRQAHAVTATFTLGEFSLGTAIIGNGNGSVTTKPSGISCDISNASGSTIAINSGTCNHSFTASSFITLTATAGLESVFNGWSGACSSVNSNDCVVHLTQAEEVTATFTLNQYDFALYKAGNGVGTIESGPIGLGCVDCGSIYDYENTPITMTVDYGTVLTLTATAGNESQFDGWSGSCLGTSDCQITLDQNKSLTGTFSLNNYSLAVNKVGNGDGVISSQPAGIACGSNCSSAFPFGTAVTLTPTPNSGSVFSGWSGACSSHATCTVPISQTESVTATFTLVTHTLSVSLDGDGSGSVADDLNQLICNGNNCEAVYDHNTPIVLSAAPAVGSLFAGWSGACAGNGICVITLDQARSVSATFDLIPVQETMTHTLTVTILGDGSGTVSSNPTGIACTSGSCDADYAENTLVTLTATPADGSQFHSWGGACAATTTDTCTVAMNRAKTVTASFRVEPVVQPMPYKIYLPLTARP